MNHIALAQELFIKHNVSQRGFGQARLQLHKLNLPPEDINKVTDILKTLCNAAQ